MAYVVNRISISTMALAAACLLTACQPSNSGTNSTAQTQTPPAPPPLPLAATPVQTQAAPPTARLPSSSRRVHYATLADPRDAYAYADQAYAMSSAFADAPPDYALDDDGVRPLVWRSHDDDYQVAEPTPYGYRYYYYRSGRAEPFMVRDPDYAYSYADGQLVAVFDRDGRPVPVDDARRREDSASRLLYRAERLFELLRRGARTSASAPNWAEHRRYFDEDRARWASAAQRNPDWTDYDQRHSAELNGYWSAEAVRRRQEANDFNTWRDRGYQGEPPPRVYAPPPPPPGPSGVVGQLMQLLNRNGDTHRDGDHRDQRPQGAQPPSPAAQPSPPAPAAPPATPAAKPPNAPPAPATPPANTPPAADWRQRQVDQHVAPPVPAAPPSPALPSTPQNNFGSQGHEHRPFAGPPTSVATSPPAAPSKPQLQPPSPPAPPAPAKPLIVTPTPPPRPLVIAPAAVKPPPPPLPKPLVVNLTPAQQQALREAVAKATGQPTSPAAGQPAVRPVTPPPPAPAPPAPKTPAAPTAKPSTPPPHPANAVERNREGVNR